MQCLEPISIPNPKGFSNADRITVPCGKCAACLTNRRNEWTSRLEYELADAKSAYFVTLTYNNEHVPCVGQYPTLVKSDLQNYFKRLRKIIKPNKIRYYAVGEYGTKYNRPHYHILLFNLPPNFIDAISTAWTKEKEEIGFVSIGTITSASIHYCTKYHLNKTSKPNELSADSFVLMSRHPGIGAGYIERYGSFHRNNIDRTYLLKRGGFKTRFPRYYQTKLYTEEERHRQGKIRLSLMQSVYDPVKIKEFQDDHPGVNYFEYIEQQKENFSKKFKEKSNINDKL